MKYYRNMLPSWSHMLAILTRFMSIKRNFKWTEVKKDAFDEIKQIVARDNLSTYPDFNETFKIHTNASTFQLVVVLIHKGKPIAFYSIKLTGSQQQYMVIERELISIVETLKEFRNISLGQKIRINTDHKNLTFKYFNNKRVLRWGLILE